MRAGYSPLKICIIYLNPKQMVKSSKLVSQEITLTIILILCSLNIICNDILQGSQVVTITLWLPVKWNKERIAHDWCELHRNYRLLNNSVLLSSHFCGMWWHVCLLDLHMLPWYSQPCEEQPFMYANYTRYNRYDYDTCH